MNGSKCCKWNDELIEQRIREVIDVLSLSHFPTKKEMEDFYGNKSLSVAVSKHGGSKLWSEKIGISQKNSMTLFGNQFEEIALKEITEKTGLSTEYTTCHYAYDILVDGSVKIDVKVSKLYHRNGSDYCCTFNIEKKKPTCDIFLLYCLDGNGNPYKKILIPSVALCKTTQVGVGQQSRWDIYKDRWDLINEYARFFSAYKETPERLKSVKHGLSEPIAG